MKPEKAVGPIRLDWRSVGPGGGGGHIHPAISPVDPDLMLFDCDMGGIYISTDGSKSWRTLPGDVVRKLTCPAAFHPANADVILIITRWGLFVSRDRGLTWENTLGSGRDSPMTRFGGTGVTFDPENPETVVAGFSLFAGEKGHFVHVSRDCGRTWSRLRKWPDEARSDCIVFDPASPADARVIYTIGPGGLLRTSDWGTTWETLSHGLPATGQGGEVRPTSLGAAFAAGGDCAFYVTVPSRNVAGRYEGGVYKSTDRGRTWHCASDGLYRKLRVDRRGELMQYGSVTTGRSDTDLAYVVSSGVLSEPERDRAIWRTTDGGRSWSCVTFGPHYWKRCNFTVEWMNEDLSGGWWWSGGPHKVTCCASDPKRVLFMNGGNAFLTRDAGERWEPIYTDRTGAGSYRGRGCEVLTCYQLYAHPSEPGRRWITYTDIGLFTSSDGGESWAYAAKGAPWANTCYEIAVDPASPGRLYGAWSDFHDLPHWKMLRRGVETSKGGVCVSDDHGMSWRPLWGPHSPPGDLGTCTTVALDVSSPPGQRVLYAGFLNSGVWRSGDGGATWAEANRGLPEPPKRNVWRLVLHPDGTLYCGITANFPEARHIPGGLFRSTDGAQSWQPVGAEQPFDWIFGVALDPRDSKVVYVSCFEVPPEDSPAKGASLMGTDVPWPKGNGRGGVYKTSDGGRTWRKILDSPYCWDATVDPKSPDTVFACTFIDGIYLSRDAGASFTKVAPPPFVMTHRLTVDPLDERVIWVTTFGGGVWRALLPQGV